MTVALILYFLLAIVLMFRLLLYGIRPTKTLAWLLAIFTIPIGGILFYFILGRNRRKNKFYQLKKTKEITQYYAKVDDYYNTLDKSKESNIPTVIKEHIKLAKLITKGSKFIPTHNNELIPLKNGKATFEAIFTALKKAKNFIHIQYYIFEEGNLAEKFKEILIEKAKKGVEIRFLYDALGSRTLSNKYLKSLKEAGIQVYSFLPMRLGKFLSSINYRNHRKIIIVDGIIGYTGGINVSDKYITGDAVLGNWYDMHLQLKGSVVNSLQAVFALDWSFASGNDSLLNIKYFLENSTPGKSTAQIVASGPDSDFSSIHQLYFSIINSAKKYVYITNPYIIPGEAIKESLQVAAMSGIDVRLLLSANSDSFLVKWNVRSHFENLLESGVKIYLYPDGFLHSKVIISDNELTSIGTANLDIRSFEQNYEVNTLIYDSQITSLLKQDFLKDCKKSNKINYQEYLKRPKTDRLKEGLAKVFSPVL
ncbi:cardiolipin synthase [Polaribacter sp. Hel1_85]|uniref:cardiolipin synthase n=1 Tax=Polaribacter sp. Hel1_85 TaxID=1250005 RepID=UPI00052CB5E4|nr:cardiolipin synthase [Polaribacter sp. Hel1_85]KGL64291.1 cardiolipin synthetase [Polaribacter sp. Hel1_85]